MRNCPTQSDVTSEVLKTGVCVCAWCCVGNCNPANCQQQYEYEPNDAFKKEAKMIETRLRMLVNERLKGANQSHIRVARGEIAHMLTVADAMKASIDEGKSSPAYIALRQVFGEDDIRLREVRDGQRRLDQATDRGRSPARGATRSSNWKSPIPSEEVTGLTAADEAGPWAAWNAKRYDARARSDSGGSSQERSWGPYARGDSESRRGDDARCYGGGSSGSGAWQRTTCVEVPHVNA